MLPVLIDLKFIKIYTFGVFLVLALFWACFILWKNIRLTAQKEDEIFDGLFLAIAGSLLFGRLTYVILNFKDFGFNLFKFILINGYPGISVYGLLLGGFSVFYIYLMLKEIKFSEIVDYLISPLFIALAFAKLGSFLAGSEVGSKTNFMLSIKYFGYDGLRHLTPLYEAIFFSLGAYISYKLLFEVRKQKFARGFVFYFFCWYFALVYFLFDNIKADRLYLTGLSFNFIVSAAILAIFSVYFLYYFRNSLILYGKPTYQKITKKISGRSTKRRTEVTKTHNGTKKE